MTSLFHSDPVGLPGLAALALGFLTFFAALMAARWRATKVPKVADASSNRRSWIWIIVQGLGIGIAGAGRIQVSLDPMSPKALIEGAVVLVLMLGAVWLFNASSRTMGKNWSLVARTREDHQLVQTGPFAVVRHPIYVALFQFLLAMAISYGHARQLIFAIPVYAFATWMRVRYEERLLRAQFGADYDAYATRVKRFVPGVF
ncbi:MAG: isoprenylcysteine carboxylmethyltransferase family protein [Sphingomonas bacterium]|uniref:methyltransferase family protein n=1 Tax=Sphingomonas bacterium TaxID=1895847 RepID=UPI00261AB002|nr:isoprenylcysteine carboxylmethyltransferase family protein [Sphingomonas bacterium]MDB5705674.1 isoprenylcysteine carboxylmethyltransferase family protein [Sphingomonas bacterium]